MTFWSIRNWHLTLKSIFLELLYRAPEILALTFEPRGSNDPPGFSRHTMCSTFHARSKTKPVLFLE